MKSPTAGLSSNWKALQSRLKSSSASLSTTTTTKTRPVASSASSSKVGKPLPKAKSKSKLRPNSKTIPQTSLSSAQKLRSLSTATELQNAKTTNNNMTQGSSGIHQQLLSLQPSSAGAMKRTGNHVALDCEFVGSKQPNGTEISLLARVSIVNYFGTVLMDDFVKPEPNQRITDFRTWVSGVTAKDVLYNPQAITYKEAVKKVADLIHNRTLVGHALSQDLKVLQLTHPPLLTKDTAQNSYLKKQAGVRGKAKPSLKKLTALLLNETIQTGQHSSVEDARAAMLLYRKFKDEF